MIRLEYQPMNTLDDLKGALQKAIQLQLSILPPYLDSILTLQNGTNQQALMRFYECFQRIRLG